MTALDDADNGYLSVLSRHPEKAERRLVDGHWVYPASDDLERLANKLLGHGRRGRPRKRTHPTLSEDALEARKRRECLTDDEAVFDLCRKRHEPRRQYEIASGLGAE